MYRPWSIESLTADPVLPPLEQRTLEERVQALETKLRQSNPDHPCDCKYELSLLEGKLGTLREHPFERRLDRVERKQRRDGVNLSQIYTEFQDYKEKTITLMEDYNWEYDPEGFQFTIKSTNIVLVVEKLVSRMKLFEKYMKWSEARLKALHDCYQDMKENVSVATTFNIEQMMDCQDNVADELIDLRDETTELKQRVAELKGMKDGFTNDIQLVAERVDTRVKELEDTISSIPKEATPSSKLSSTSQRTSKRGTSFINTSDSTDRTIWVPGTSITPNVIPYTQNIPTVLEQPEGWGDARAEICRELEESQLRYYSSQQFSDGDGAACPPLDTNLEEILANTPSKKKKKKKKTRKQKSDYSIADGATVKVEEDSQMIRQLSPTSILEDNDCNEHTITEPPFEQVDIEPPNDKEFDPKIADQATKLILSQKSKPAIKKSKPSSIRKPKDKAKYLSLDEVFKQGKSAQAWSTAIKVGKTS
ncbi:hypothetical protein H072_6224 [Dactylellina haptotyla CBS 200.50]|uniref:Uncharacterized protein n=1 Tax=Dactylellina haptotyla (strain CBS 200.50) TaxID=1284197 RepID=S8AFG9_DACHA|nr:hypothetical protein H072_6224 [Dactylellina haptotyla CBS 200.50]